MPRRRTQSQTRGLVLGAGAVVVAVGALAVISVLVNQGTIEPQLGDEEFDAGRTERIAAEIDDRGPITYPDASAQRRRDIVLQHLGDDPSKGWLAFSARPEEQDDRRCNVQWDAQAEVFRDPCSANTYPPDGEGLTTYPTRVADGRVYIRFRPEEAG